MNIRNVVVALLCPILLIPFAFATEGERPAQPIQMQGKTITVIQIEDQRIYSAAVMLPSGEIAYFASEPIFNEDREKKWQMYANATNSLVGSSRGIIRDGVELAHMKEGGLENFYSALSALNCFPSDSHHKKQFFEIFNAYILHIHKQTTDVTAPFRGIASGVVGMHHSIGCRINYISKRPVRGLFNFPDKDMQPQNLEDYMSAYDDIVMSVSTFHTKGLNGENYYQHRGIFRNPLSMLRRDYKDLGLSIHAFSARAWHLENPQEEIMMVDPDGSVVMKGILLKEFKNDELSSSDRPTSDEKLRQFHEKNRRGIMIKIDALEKRF